MMNSWIIVTGLLGVMAADFILFGHPMVLCIIILWLLSVVAVLRFLAVGTHDEDE